MKILYAFLISISFIACSEAPKEDGIKNEPTQETKKFMSRKEIIRHIEAQLKIPATEKYEIAFCEAHLNEDDSIDLIITVNMLQKAKNDAIETGKLAKRAEMGFVGNYNFFFYFDGGTGVITSPIPVASSPYAPLAISFENITSETHKDLLVDFRIRTSKFRQFYTIASLAPFQVCETEIFTDYGSPDEKVYAIEYEEDTYSIGRNIVIYEGIPERIAIEKPDDVYSIDPKITSTKKLIRRWYYSPKHLKYYLLKDEM